MPNPAQTKATLVVDKTTGAITAPVSAATFKNANSLGGGTPDAHAASHASAGADPVTLAESQVTGLTAALAAKAAAGDLTTHTGNVSNPHSVTKAQVGLTNADNTSDAAKPVSTATQTALDLKAAATHSHAATDITSGVMNPDRLASGSALQLFRRNAANNAIECATISPGAGDLLAANNLSDLASAATARTNLSLGNVTNTSDANKPVSTAQQTALDLKVDENGAITGATKTKVTYDAKGLVTAGADATTADIADSANKRYVTDAQQTVIGNTSGTNTGDQNLAAYAPLASPALTGTPTAPTAAVATDNTQLATTAFVHDAIAEIPAGGGTSYILIRDEKSSTTAGGTFTSGAWRTRDLNTEAADTGNHASVASNQITLLAGTYRIRAIVPCHAVEGNKAKLRNVTDSTDTIIGTSGYAYVTGATSSHAVFIDGRFTIAGTKTFEIQHYCNTTMATYGFGVPVSISAIAEVYTVVVLERES